MGTLEKLALIPSIVYGFIALMVLLFLSSFVPIVGNYVLGLGFIIAGYLTGDWLLYKTGDKGKVFRLTFGMIFGTIGIMIILFNFLNINVIDLFGSVIALTPVEVGSVLGDITGVSAEPVLSNEQIVYGIVVALSAQFIFQFLLKEGEK